MTRLPLLGRDDLSDSGRELWDRLAGPPGRSMVGPEGGLIGPFNAFVHAPATGGRIAALGGTLRSGTSLERRLTEVAIITVGAHWKAEFEWYAHSAMARRHGVPDAVVEAIASGGDPPFAADDERVVYAAARQLAAGGRLDDDAYAAARDLLGDTGLVELVSLCGYYTLICTLLNAFEVDLPAGVAPVWAGSENAGA